MSSESGKARLATLLAQSVTDGTFVKLTLSGPVNPRLDLRNLLVRPVQLKAGPHLMFTFRHATKDVIKNYEPAEGARLLAEALETEFRNAHLFTTAGDHRLESRRDGSVTLQSTPPTHTTTLPAAHDRLKKRLIAPRTPWLRGLEVTDDRGEVREGMSAKFRQIQKFTEILDHLVSELPKRRPEAGPLRFVDMGCGKGYLTFAAYEHLARVFRKSVEGLGIEQRGDLVELCNRLARESRFEGLHFRSGTIERTRLETCDILVALHACDTATDDAIGAGISAGAALILVSPCCHKEVRPQLRPPPVLASVLRHGILRERQAEFVTDALRALLLERAGYATQVFEFIATEHTAKNLMISAVKRAQAVETTEVERQIRDLAAFYGVRNQRLAAQLGMRLESPAPA
jgi:SAM-dependent methyltransferase